MEDSYIVHRRRKAAARKREKTPEPSTRREQQDSSEDEEEARRARMEKMAEDTERMEVENKMKEQEQEGRREKEKKEMEEKERSRREKEQDVAVQDQGKLHVETVTVVRKISKEEVVGSREREDDTAERPLLARKVPEVTQKADEEAKSDEVKEKRREEVSKDKEGRETKERPREIVTETKVEVRRVERRIKKKSKERLAERHSRSTDSSELDEKSEASMKRTKSPEGKVRLRKAAGRSRLGHDDGKKELSEKTGLRAKEDDRSKEKKVSTRYSHTDTDDEPRHIKKSETFPRRSKEEPVMKRSATDVKKQIIPISNDSLIEDFARAQREYLSREKSILDPNPTDVFQDAQGVSGVRRRKTSVAPAEKEQEEIAASAASETASGEGKEPEEVKDTKEVKKRSWFSWIPFFGKKKEKVETLEPKPADEPETKQVAILKKPEEKRVEEQSKTSEKVTFMDFLRAMRDFVAEFKAFVAQNPEETRIMRSLRNRCLAELLLVIIYCGLGAIVFRFTEGAFETFYKCGVKRVKRDFLDTLWNYSHNLREDDWKSMARKKLMEFEEQLHTAHEAGVHTYSGQRSWTFLNAVVYCLTVITTIGYGHISPSTTTGRAITIVYAIFGIPMFLIILADFGKLFTRGIKFLWAFVRRVYYTGSCRKVRRTVPVQEVMKGVQLVYDLATFRRPSQMNPEDIEEMQKQAQQSQTVLNLDGNVPDTPGTPAMSTFAIDDEFNLPISVAIIILIGYIFIGATLYYLWEDWGFFESFYFVFISMSTIGFGDYVPKHPIYMMCSIIYLVFGLALTSMCINVVQVMLSDSFRQASQKIGATIGFEIAEDDGSVKPAPPPPVEIADVHTSVKESESEEKIAPKAKQEDVDL